MKLDTRHLLASATPLTAAKPAAQEDAGSRAQKAQSKQLAEMQEALTKLRAMPSPRVSLKRAATERATMLKRRLDMMKQMLIGASPEMAKRIAAQIKSIAKELASLGKTLATGGGKAAPTPENASVAPAVGNAAEARVPSGSEAAAASEVPAVESAGAAENTSNDGPPETGESVSASQREGLAAYAAQSAQSSGDSQGTKENDDQEKAADKELKKALSEAANALRQLIAMLRNKIGAAHKDVQEAAAQLREIERNMAGTDTASSQTLAPVAAVELAAGTPGGMASPGINLAA